MLSKHQRLIILIGSQIFGQPNITNIKIGNNSLSTYTIVYVLFSYGPVFVEYPTQRVLYTKLTETFYQVNLYYHIWILSLKKLNL